MPSWLGGWEIAIVVVIALLVFGPKKLPELGSSLGKSITGFRKGLKDSADEVKAAMKEDVTADAPAAQAAPAATAAPAAPASESTVTNTVETEKTE